MDVSRQVPLVVGAFYGFEKAHEFLKCDETGKNLGTLIKAYEVRLTRLQFVRCVQDRFVFRVYTIRGDGKSAANRALVILSSKDLIGIIPTGYFPGLNEPRLPVQQPLRSSY